MISAARRTRASHGNIHDRFCCCYWRSTGRATTRCVSRFSLSSKQSSMESFPQTLLSARRVVVFYWFSSYLAPESSRPFQPPLFPLGVFPFLPDLETFYLLCCFSAERKSWSKFAYPWRIHSTDVWVCDEPPRNETSLESSSDSRLIRQPRLHIPVSRMAHHMDAVSDHLNWLFNLSHCLARHHHTPVHLSSLRLSSIQG